MFIKYSADYLDGGKVFSEVAQFEGTWYEAEDNRVYISLVSFKDIILIMNERQYNDFVDLISGCILDKTKLLTIEGTCFIIDEDDEGIYLDKTPCSYSFKKDGRPYI